MRKKLLIALIAVAVVLVAVVGGTALYARYENGKAPEALGLSTATSTPRPTADGAGDADGADGADGAGTAAGDLSGAWTVGDGSQAGYRVDEVLNNQDVTVVGRTDDVDGTVTIAGTDLTAAAVTVSMTTVATDNSGRDGQFLDILHTADFPTSTFTLTSPVDIGAITAGVASVQATGDLTIAGVTAAVTVDLEAQTTATGVEVSGSIPVSFSDYGIEAPDLGFVKVEDAGTVEMLLQLTK
ncbi:YceI family protein [Pengzhenrongella sicca]|uniref:YceI family protein n=1 Tax=Pengzhenrongella sicca TaxID=2819238 RepID=UPI001D0C10E7|nr:YceI family protein [Pengzhenrongella sicca]